MSAKARTTSPVIRASEIGQYAYCARAWWLSSVAGVPSANANDLQRGTAWHQRHGRAVWLSRALIAAAAVLIGLAFVILLIAVVQ